MSKLKVNLTLYSPFKNKYVSGQVIIIPIFLLLAIVSGLIYKHDIDTGKIVNIEAIFSHLSFFGSMIILGKLVAAVHLDVLTKPFSYCIPDQNKLVRKSILLAGIAGDMLFCFILFLVFQPAGLTDLFYFISIFALGFSFFLSTIWVMLSLKNEYKKYILYIYIIASFFQLSFVNSKTEFLFSFADFIQYSTLPVVLFTILLTFAIYRTFEKPDFKRNYQANNAMSFELIVPGNSAQANEALSLKALSGMVEKESLIEKLFLLAVNKLSYLGKSRALTGRAYCMIDRQSTFHEKHPVLWILSIITLPSIALLLTGYDISDMIHGSFENIIFVMILCAPCYVITTILAPIFNNHLLPQGRSEQFRNNLAVWIVHLIFSMAWFLLIIFISRMISGNMPLITITGSCITYQPLGFSLFYWPLMIIPVFDIYKYNYKYPDISSILIILIIVLAVLSVIIHVTLLLHLYVAGSVFIVLAVFIPNIVFVNMLRNSCIRKDIVLSI